jgi:RNA polymerase sigma factor (sigma-70 family)
VHLPPFQRFLEANADDVHRFLIAAVGRQDADDCFQETFLSALRAYATLTPASNLRAWVLTIARNKAMDAHRARGRRPEPVAVLPERPIPPPAEPDTVWDDVRDLPPKQRAAVVQRYVLDLSHAEIGRALGCSEDAARRNVHEGVKKLRGVAWTF